ncbi:MAG: apolipoprotein N-acyltransferase [Armatimonadota bacterium]
MQLAFQPIGWAWVAWVGLIPFFAVLIICTTWKAAAKTGFIWGLVFFGLHISWLIPFIGSHADKAWMGVFPWLFCVVVEAVYPCLFALIIWSLSRRRFISPMLAGAVWAVLEFLRSSGMFGFLWGQLAVSQSRELLILQSVSLLGSWGLSALIVAVNFAIINAYKAKCVRPLYTTAILIVICVIYGATTIFHTNQSTPTLKVTVIQPNIEVTHTPEYQTIPKVLEKAQQGIQIARNMDSSLLVYPESYLPDTFPGMLDEGLAAISKQGITILAGGGWSVGKDSFNAVSAYDNGKITHYVKQHLIPWGEYIPYRKAMPWVAEFGANFGDRTAGHTSDVLTSYRIGSPICFESTLPWVSQQMVNKGARLLCVVTNDSWFGNSPAAQQHFEFSALRAAEHHRWLVRSALTGVSGLFSPTGEVLRTTPKYKDCSFNCEVGLITAKTLYTRLGDIPSLVILLLIGVLTSWRATRRTSVEMPLSSPQSPSEK